MIGARGRRHEQSEPAWLTNGSAREPKLCDWVENNLEETFTFSRLPHQHHKHLQSTNMLERRKRSNAGPSSCAAFRMPKAPYG
jgi:transposase-like protein